MKIVSVCSIIVACSLLVPGQASANSERKPRETRSVDSRVFGGATVNINRVPWQAGLIFDGAPMADSSRLDQFQCGAVFVQPTIALTAAHCVSSKSSPAEFVDPNGNLVFIDRAETKVSGWKIISGVSDLTSPAMDVFEIEDVIVHPSYDDFTADFDLAIIKIRGTFEGTTVRILNTEESDRIVPGDGVQVSGWGRTRTSPVSRRLKELTVPVVRRVDCNDENSYDDQITQRMVCAGFRNGMLDSCNGDSGGPLTVRLDIPSPIPSDPPTRVTRLMGLVSWGEGCALREKYGVYARLIRMSDFLAQHDVIE